MERARGDTRHSPERGHPPLKVLRAQALDVERCRVRVDVDVLPAWGGRNGGLGEQ